MPAVADEEPADAAAVAAALEGAGGAAGPAGAAPGAVGRATRALAHALQAARVRVRHLALDVPDAAQAQRDRPDAAALVPVGLHRRRGCKQGRGVSVRGLIRAGSFL